MAQANTFFPGVIATGTMGTTNPPVPTLGTSINQTSFARLLTVNSIDDFCIFAPPSLANISDSETFEVAWCTQPRNNARVIPDGTMTGVSFLKTDAYIQVYGYGDFTRLNIPNGDFGGELDPHGAFGSGNPIGGNVTSNITGSDQNYADAAQMCWHELDEMGCGFVMPGNYNFNGTFESCEADVAYPPGWYPTATVSGTTLFSTFAQFFTGVANGVGYTVGDTVTPSAPYMTPSSSNCVTTASVSNGIDLVSLGITTSATPTAGASVSDNGASIPKATGTLASGHAASPTNSSVNGASGSPVQTYPVVILVALLSGLSAVFLFH
ncbi:hypothetical protein C0993_005030 [Termitomyces sp. T159_Od127]|nr:hypothetical protein C0993_005030 [Termitomyces sp. T159_Od127]